MAKMAELYQHEMSEAMLALYFEDLGDFSIADVVGALSAHRKDPDRGRFFPKPADVVHKVDGDLKTQALRAWDQAAEAALEFGAYESVRFPDPTIMKVITAMGGWTEWYDWPDKEMPFRQKEFCERYVAYRNASRDEDKDLYLLGMHEIHAKRNGLHFNRRPALIGTDTVTLMLT